MKKQNFMSIMGNTGASLLQVVLIGGAISAMLFFGADRLKNLKEDSSVRKGALYTQGVASGALAYAQFILENRMCVDVTTGIAKEKCEGFKDEGNLERLLLFPQTVNDINQRFLKKEIAKDKKNAITNLNEMEVVIDKDKVLPAHPLYPILYEKKAAKIKEVKITYKSSYDPSFGNTYKVKIIAEVISYKNLKLKILGGVETSIYGLRELMIYPRIMNYFSLILNRNLVIGEGKGVHKEDEVSKVRQVNKLLTNAGGAKVGMNFYSPVMVNSDFIIPEKGAKAVDYATFYSPVFIGGNFKTNDDEFFKPQNANKGEVYRDYKAFKGLRAGIVRVNTEPSLGFLFRNDYSGELPKTLVMQECIKYAKRKYERTSTYNSRAVIRKGSKDGEFYLGLTQLNEFLPSSWKKYRKGYLSGGTLDEGQFTSEDPKKLPVLGAEIYLNGDNKKRWLRKKWINYKVATEAQVYQLALDKPETFPARNLFEFTKNTVFDPIAQVCKDDAAFDSNTVDANLYPLIELTASKPTGATNSVVQINVDIIKRFSRVDNKTYDDKIDWIKVPEDYWADVPTLDASGNLTFTASGSKITHKEKKTKLVDKKIVTPREGPYRKGKDVYCGFQGEWIKNDDMALVMYPYNFRNHSEKPNAVEDIDYRWGGPNNFYAYETRKIKFKRVKVKELDGEEYENEHLVLDMGKYHKDDWRQLRDENPFVGGFNKSITLTEKEKTSLTLVVDPVNWADMCDDTSAVGVSDINPDFSESAFVSWNYNPVSKSYQYHPVDSAKKDAKKLWEDIFKTSGTTRNFLNELVINKSNEKIFHVYSVLDRCIVEADANYVTGFLVCRHMIIKKRAKILKMYGTFVIDQLSVDESAYRYGVNWRNIHDKVHAQKYFFESKILGKSQSCESTATKPNWLKASSPEDLAKGKNCGAASLIVKSDPFTWTSFDPSCGLNEKDTATTVCKPYSRSENFISVMLNEKFRKIEIKDEE